ncbi:MAG TPA: hypothetical protein VHU40_18945, partial [Polyangia bacterium]|nr:hypothetical protein [Polyangia bacterium]
MAPLGFDQRRFNAAVAWSWVRAHRRLVGAGVAVLALLIAYPWVGGAIAARKAVAVIQERLGVPARIGQARAGLTEVVFRDVEVGAPATDKTPPLARVKLVRVPFRAALFRTGVISADGVVAVARRGGDSDNVTAIIETLRQRKHATAPGTETAPSAGSARVPGVEVSNAKVTLEDVSSGLSVQIDGVAGKLTPDVALELRAASIDGVMSLGGAGQGPHFGAGAFTVAQPLAGIKPRGYPTVTIDGGFATPLPKLSLTGIHGRILPKESKDSPAADAKELIVDLSGSYGGARETLWT